MVGLILQFPHLLSLLGGIIVQAPNSTMQCIDRAQSHFIYYGTATLQGDSRGAEQTLVQLNGGLYYLWLGQQLGNQLFQQSSHRQQQQRA